MKKLAQCSALALGVLLSTTCFAEYMNPIAFPQSGDPTDVQVIVEIPAGSFTKYELDAARG
jgi:inorganic pyrophosphatase